jgi:NADPH:quinone reductase-like Zn-dependent oxidoreductase
MAVQLAKLSGYIVIAVTSSQFRLKEVEARGADKVFSNDDPDLLSKIGAVAPHLRFAFDTVVTDETIDKICQSMPLGGIIATAIKYVGPAPNNVQLQPVFSGEIFGKTMSGSESARGRVLGQRLWPNLSQWLDSGDIKALEYEEIGGLADIEGGLGIMREGRSKVKLVARTI